MENISTTVSTSTYTVPTKWQFCAKCGCRVGQEWTYCAECGTFIGTLDGRAYPQWVPTYPPLYPYEPYKITWGPWPVTC